MRKFANCVVSLLLVVSLAGCSGLAGNYNPEVNAEGVGTFWKANDAEIGYLYDLFKSKNNFTPEQKETLSISRYTIMAVIERMKLLRMSGGVSYQDFKSLFGLATNEYYKMMPILRSGMVMFEGEREPKIIFENMVNRTDYFISNCNLIISRAEEDIDARGMDNLKKFGEGFYNALAPILDAAI